MPADNYGTVYEARMTVLTPLVGRMSCTNSVVRLTQLMQVAMISTTVASSAIPWEETLYQV